jgi:regulatory protein
MAAEGTRKPRKLDAEALWENALRLLAARAHSVGELREKLRRKAAEPADVARVIDRLKSYGYLDDRAYAENYAGSRLEAGSHGKFRVLRELRGRRVAPGVARAAVEKVYAGADETELVEEYLRRKYRKVSLADHLADPRRLAAAYRRLRYAGFSAAASIRVLERYSPDAAALEAGEGEEETE